LQQLIVSTTCIVYASAHFRTFCFLFRRLCAPNPQQPTNKPGPRKWSHDSTFISGKEDVDALRAEFFGSEVMIQALNSAVALLSKGLYSADAHFVHELLQNAVDNSYDVRRSYGIAVLLSALDC
jgi:hypothetical protein